MLGLNVLEIEKREDGHRGGGFGKNFGAPKLGSGEPSGKRRHMSEVMRDDARLMRPFKGRQLPECH